MTVCKAVHRQNVPNLISASFVAPESKLALTPSSSSSASAATSISSPPSSTAAGGVVGGGVGLGLVGVGVGVGVGLGVGGGSIAANQSATEQLMQMLQKVTGSPASVL